MFQFVRPNNVGGLVVANKAAIVSERNQSTIKAARIQNSSSFPATSPSTSTKHTQFGGTVYKKFPTASGSILPRSNGNKPPTGAKASQLPVRPYTTNVKQTEPEIEQLGAVIDSMINRPKTTDRKSVV